MRKRKCGKLKKMYCVLEKNVSCSPVRAERDTILTLAEETQMTRKA